VNMTFFNFMKLENLIMVTFRGIDQVTIDSDSLIGHDAANRERGRWNKCSGIASMPVRS
jgi:hypothetical protein